MKIFKQLSLLFISGLAVLVLASTPKVWAQTQPTTATEEASNAAQTTQPVVINFFFSRTCPHCAEEAKFLSTFVEEHPEVQVHAFEVTSSRENALLLQKIGKDLGIQIGGTPMTFIGHQYFVGYKDEATHGTKIADLVEQCQTQTESCPDLVAAITNQEDISAATITDADHPASPTPAPQVKQENNDQDAIQVPFLGELKPTSVSLPVLAVVIGTLDGFNPCAMWTLVFLISLLLGLHNKRRMWLLGSAFILASGFVYFLFMTAWLQLFLFLGLIWFVRIGIGIFALAAGFYNLRDYWINKDGACKVESSNQKKQTFEKIKDIIHRQSIWLALLGIVLLAFAVNLVELLCSAGLPAVFTQVLAMNHLAWWQYYSYMFVYLFFFMLDDMIVFVIAMKTLQMVGIDTKYSRYSRLIGGIVIFLIGVLMIFKPEWLSFS